MTPPPQKKNNIMQWAEFCGGKRRLSSEARKTKMAKTKNKNKSETTVHTYPTKDKYFLDVLVFCPAHILRTDTVN